MDREYKSSLRCLKIGDKVAELPIIQGGMGVGVSRSSNFQTSQTAFVFSIQNNILHALI